jgi:hypothetical protein
LLVVVLVAGTSSRATAPVRTAFTHMAHTHSKVSITPARMRTPVLNRPPFRIRRAVEIPGDVAVLAAAGCAPVANAGGITGAADTGPTASDGETADGAADGWTVAVPVVPVAGAGTPAGSTPPVPLAGGECVTSTLVGVTGWKVASKVDGTVVDGAGARTTSILLVLGPVLAAAREVRSNVMVVVSGDSCPTDRSLVQSA